MRLRLIPVIALLMLAGACGGSDSAGNPFAEQSQQSSSTAGVEPGDSGSSAGVVPIESDVETTSWGRVADGYVVAVMKDGAGRSDAEAAAEVFGGSVIGQIEIINLFQISVPGGGEAALESAITSLETADGVSSAFPDLIKPLREGEIWGVRTSPLRDPAYQNGRDGGYRMIGLEKAEEYIRGSGIPLFGVGVGMTDTGLNGNLDEFSGDMQFVQARGGINTDPRGIPGHGTEVASMIGADNDNGGVYGTASVLEGSLDLVVANDSGSNTTAMAEMTSMVEDDGVTVVNISWGADTKSTDPNWASAYKTFFEQMHANHPNVVFVCAAGNDGAEVVNGNTFEANANSYYPCGHNLPNVITVGNVNNDGTTHNTSIRGNQNYEVTLAAPGDQAVRVDDTGAVLDSNGGTSMAAPQVAGVVAMMKALDPDLTAKEIKEILKSSARTVVETPASDVDPDGEVNVVDSSMGAGVVAADLAVLTVINRIRERNGLSVLTPQQMEDLGVIDAVAVPETGGYAVRGIVRGCRGDCTTVSIHPSSGGLRSGVPEQQLSAPGEVSWSVRLEEYPATIFVRRWDNGAGSRITIDRVPIAGRWAGTMQITEIIVPEGAELPDGEPIEPGPYSLDEFEQCSQEFGEAIDEGMQAAFERIKDPLSLEMVFTGTWEEPGSVSLVAGDGTGDERVEIPWWTDGTSLQFQFADETTYVAFSGTPSGATITGSVGWLVSDPESGDVELRGVFGVNKVED